MPQRETVGSRRGHVYDMQDEFNATAPALGMCASEPDDGLLGPWGRATWYALDADGACVTSGACADAPCVPFRC